MPTVSILGPPASGKKALAQAFAPAPFTVTPTLPEDAGAVVFTFDVTQPDVSLQDCIAFLNETAARREVTRTVGGLPVFVVLTKCDTLLERGDTPGEWLSRVAEHANTLQRTLDDTAVVHHDGFGALNVQVVCTATTPLALGGTPKDADGRFGVQACIQRVNEAAIDYAKQTRAVNRRLRVTSLFTTVFVAVLLGATVVLAVTGGPSPVDPLAAQVRAYQTQETAPEVRLSKAELGTRMAALQTIRLSPGFMQLPPDLRTFVDERLDEFKAYVNYKAKFEPPRLNPATVASDAELTKLETELKGELRPPTEYETAWEKTDVVHLRQKWQADAVAVRQAEVTIHTWYRGLIQQANDMIHATTFDSPWQHRLDAFLKESDTLPIPPERVLEGSVVLESMNSQPVKAATAYEFTRIDDDRRDWDETKTKLLALQKALVATGVLVRDTAAPLVIPLPMEASGTKEPLANVWKALALHDRVEPLWPADRFPDPAATLLKAAYQRAHAVALKHVEAILTNKAPNTANDTPTGWAQFTKDPMLTDWGKVLETLATLAGEPAINPVEELFAFMAKPRHDFRFSDIGLSIPSEVVIPADSKLKVLVTPAGKETITLFFIPKGKAETKKGQTVIHFVPDGHRGEFHLAPGDGLQVTVATEAGDMVWKQSKTRTFPLDVLANPPLFIKGTQETAMKGVKIVVTPATGVPTVPVLLPTPKP